MQGGALVSATHWAVQNAALQATLSPVQPTPTGVVMTTGPGIP